MSSPMNVGFALYPGCTLLDFAGATQIFAYTDVFKPVWIAANRDPIATTEGVTVNPNATFNDHPPLSIVFVPGGGDTGVGAAMLDPLFQAWLKREAGTAEWVGSVCTGALILAAAGAFDGCAATTYWSARSVLAMFPEITVVPGYPRWHVDEARRRFSGGGISSSLDLALRLIEVIGNVEQARLSQLRNQYAPQPPLHSGDPTEASPELVIEVTQSQASFTAGLTAATKKVLGLA
ncbi:DJ-1/PfpI family protein [Lysobacter fragariae]